MTYISIRRVKKCRAAFSSVVLKITEKPGRPLILDTGVTNATISTIGMEGISKIGLNKKDAKIMIAEKMAIAYTSKLND